MDDDKDTETAPHQHVWWTSGGAWTCDCGATKPRVVGPGV